MSPFADVYLTRKLDDFKRTVELTDQALGCLFRCQLQIQVEQFQRFLGILRDSQGFLEILRDSWENPRDSLKNLRDSFENLKDS